MNVPRIIFNFNDKCLNGCPFCFIPFNNKGHGNLHLWENILKRINEISPKMLSFSGCDPLYYDDFYTLLKNTEKTCVWGIDTSLIYLNRRKFAEIHNKIDLISTSVDDVPQMPIKQRYNKKILDMFWSNFGFVKNLLPQIVVHTLYSHRNADYLTLIADELVLRKVRTWSLYQFWPFEFIKNTEDFECTLTEFTDKGKLLSAYCENKIDFEYVPFNGRSNGYFFVSSLGDVYTTLGGEVGRYYALGSIFDEDIVEKWYNNSTPSKSNSILALKLRRETKD